MQILHSQARVRVGEARSDAVKTFSRTRVEEWPLDAIGPVTARSFTNGGMVDAELIRIKPSSASNRVLVRMGHTQRITTQAKPGQARFGGKGTPVCAVGHVESNKRCGHLLSLADEYECDENATDPNTGKCVDPPHQTEEPVRGYLQKQRWRQRRGRVQRAYRVGNKLEWRGKSTVLLYADLQHHQYVPGLQGLRDPMNHPGQPSQRVGVMLAFVCLGLAARGVLLGISSATVSATARVAATRPIPFSKLFWEQAYAPRNATVRIGYLTALDEPVRRTIVRESPGRVAIELLVVRSTPSSGVGIVRCLTVPLRHPLRHRLLIDGASGRPPTYHRGSGAPPIIFRFLHLNRRRCPPAPRIRRIS